MLRWSRSSAIAGTIVWLILLNRPLSTSFLIDGIVRLLLLAILIFVPLGLSPGVLPDHSNSPLRIIRAAQWLQPLAAILVTFSFLLPVDLTAALLASSWLLCTALIALYGLTRFLSHRFTRIEEVCIDAGLIYLPIGSAWLLFSRLGLNPLGFGDQIVLLTAVHFHYAGFAAPILAGLVGRTLRETSWPIWKLFRFVAIGVISGPPLIAIGITFSPLIEVAAVIILVTSLVALSIVTLVFVVPKVQARVAQALLVISSLAVIAAMILALSYGVSKFAHAPVLSIPQMIQVHGLLNGFGFVLCGLLAWNLLYNVSSGQAENM